MLPCIRIYAKINIYITHSVRVYLYKTIIKRISTYGAESWTLRNKIEKSLMTWERKILRKVCGLTYENGSWRIKMNQEITANLNLRYFNCNESM